MWVVIRGGGTLKREINERILALMVGGNSSINQSQRDDGIPGVN